MRTNGAAAGHRPAVQAWTAGDAVALQVALRWGDEDFAKRVGVSPRVIAGWRAFPAIRPMFDHQRRLDQLLIDASPDERGRFLLQRAPATSSSGPERLRVAVAVVPDGCGAVLLVRRQQCDVPMTWRFPVAAVRVDTAPLTVAVQAVYAQTGVRVAGEACLGSRRQRGTHVLAEYCWCRYVAGEPFNRDRRHAADVQWVDSGTRPGDAHPGIRLCGTRSKVVSEVKDAGSGRASGGGTLGRSWVDFGVGGPPRSIRGAAGGVGGVGGGDCEVDGLDLVLGETCPAPREDESAAEGITDDGPDCDATASGRGRFDQLHGSAGLDELAAATAGRLVADLGGETSPPACGPERCEGTVVGAWRVDPGRLGQVGEVDLIAASEWLAAIAMKNGNRGSSVRCASSGASGTSLSSFMPMIATVGDERGPAQG